MTLDFLNKNMYRKYPLRASSSGYFLSGEKCPNNLICGLSISTLTTNSVLYVSKIVVSSQNISIFVNDYGSEEVIGIFSGQVTANYTNLSLQSVDRYSSGVITLGSADILTGLQGAHTFSKADGLIEASCVYLYTPPAVNRFVVKGKDVFGLVKLTLDNLRVSYTGNDELTLGVVNRQLILSNGDLSGAANNCGIPVITQINTVTPDALGNIDIYTISPLEISVSGNQLNVTTALTLPDVCPEKQQLEPPTDDSDEYYTNILTATEEEWRNWPIFT